MLVFAVLDILADDWVQSRQASARRYGTTPSRLPLWWAAIRSRFSGRKPETPVGRPAAAPNRLV